MSHYACDFETDTTHSDSTFVWAWGIMECGTEHMQYGTNIKGFINTAFELEGENTFWFHNLKFDGSFIVDYLIYRCAYNICEDSYKQNNKTIYTLISGMGQWYQIKVKSETGKIITIQNSLTKLPFKVSAIAKSLKLEKLKGEIDYSIYRKEGGELSKEDYEYLYNDVWIMATALQNIFFNHGYDKMTIGSDCINEYKSIVGAKAYNYWFPYLDNSIDEFCRKAYKGGYTYKNPNIEHVYNGCTYDYNSMYPSVMHSKSGYDYPYGQPEYFEGIYEYDEEYPLFIQRFSVDLKLKDGYVPTIQLKGTNRFSDNEYIVKSDGYIELTLCNVDLDIMFEHYEIYDIEFLDGYKFMSRNKMFDKYIDKWYAIKEESSITGDTVMRQLSKLFLNNLYGKFGKNPNAPIQHVTAIEYEDVVVDGEVFKEYGKLIFSTEENEGRTLFIPIAIWCTAYARKELITALQLNYEYFCYCDTDSLHLSCSKEDVKGIRIHETDLCAWKCEGIWSEAIFIRQKTYMEYIDGKWLIKCAGMPDNLKKLVNPDNFKIGFKAFGKLTPKRVRGGIILVEGWYEIRE